MKDLDISGLVSARICHDLASPIGAMMNGADLIGHLDPGDAGDEIAMVAQSAKRAAAILKFHRLAFGSIGDAVAQMSHRDLHGRAAAVLTGPRVALDWQPDENGVIPVSIARMACNMLLIARAALGRGGALSVRIAADGALPLWVTARGQRVQLSDEQRRLIDGELTGDLQSRQVEFALMTPVAASAGARIELAEKPDELRLTARPAGAM